MWKFTVDQENFENITITNLPTSKLVAITQFSTINEHDQKIMVKHDKIDDLIDALKSAKKWSM